MKLLTILLALMLISSVGCQPEQLDVDTTPDDSTPESDSSESQEEEETMVNFNEATEAQIAEWRTMTDERIDEIRNSPNMEIPEGVTVFYVSPNGNNSNDGTTPETAWQNIAKLNNTALPEGSYVCFERGGVWRGSLSAQSGVTYTAYGEGEKPKIYASNYNYAGASKWNLTDTENVWTRFIGPDDVGTIVFNDGEAHGIKCVIRTEADGTTYNNTTGEPFSTYADLNGDLHFYHDAKSGRIYIYSEQNPGERFDSIECCVKKHIISIGGDDVTIDNLCLKYGGAHGVAAGGTVNNLTVQNCEFGWIGGSIQSEGIFGRNYGTRYGNAIEIWGGCDGFTVTNNYIYQIYDAGITQQYGVHSSETYQKNMHYAHNVIEYCNYSIEYFLSSCPAENPSRMENFVIEDNYMWYAGEGFCEQRPDKGQGSHIMGWWGSTHNRATGYEIRDNLMLYSKQMLVIISSDLYNPDGSDSMPAMSGNTYLQKLDNGRFGMVEQGEVGYEGMQIYTEKIPEYLGDKSTDDTFWYVQ